jgi:hypothetical protein
MDERKMKNEFDAIREAQALREMSDDPVAARRALDSANQTAKALRDIQVGKNKMPFEDDMGPLREARKPVRMPELKTKDTGDKNEFELKGEKIKGYENAKPMKKGGKVKCMAKGGSVGSASKRADGCATKGKTKGRII